VIFPEIVAQLRERLTIPMIVGGFIRDGTGKAAALLAGARAITTSTPELWP